MNEATVGHCLSELRDLYASGRLFTENPVTDGTTVNLGQAAAYYTSLIGEALMESQPHLFEWDNGVLPEIFVMARTPQFFASTRPQATTMQSMRGLFAYYGEVLEVDCHHMPA